MVSQQCYNCGNPVGLSAQFCSKCGEHVILKQKYFIVKALGQGGFGVVYLVQDLQSQQRYAVKVVSSASIAEQNQVAVEVDILTKYSPQFAFIPTIYEIWKERLQTFIVMEYIDGKTLDQIKTSPWSSSEVYNLLRTLLIYLQELHEVGIIHRDIKPSNIIFTSQGHYKLIDFGIAKQGVATRTIARGMGSIIYTSLEQFQGMPTDGRSDIYSLAATGYHLLTGRPPTSADARKAGSILPRPNALAPNTSAELEAALLYMLEVERADRPADAKEALRSLTKAVKSTTKVAAATMGVTSNTRSQNKTAIIVASIGAAATGIVACIGLYGQMVSSRTPVVPLPTSISSPPATEVGVLIAEPSPFPTERIPTVEPTAPPPPTSIPQPTDPPQQIPTLPPQRFSGVTGRARLDWDIGGSRYVAVIQTTGQTGIVDVNYYDPSVGTIVTVRQALNLQEYQGSWFYVGSNPVYVSTGASANYAPDIFLLAPSPSGLWTIVSICDTQYQCASVATTPLQ